MPAKWAEPRSGRGHIKALSSLLDFSQNRLRGFCLEDWSRRLVPLHGFISVPRSWVSLTQTSYLPATFYVYRGVGVAVEHGTTIRASPAPLCKLELVIDESTQMARLRSVESSQVASSTSSTSSSSSAAAPVPAGYVLVAAMSSLAGKTSAYFNHPSRGLSLLLNQGGQWNAFSATCTHAPCTVKYTGSAIYCPCHDGYFNPSNGAVTRGPPPRALHQFGVLIQDANLFVTST